MNSINRTARLAGLLYLAIAVLSAFGLVYVPSVILVPGDAAATAHNLVASESLFRLGFVSTELAFTVNIFVAVLLYKLLEPVNKLMAALMVILISVGLAIAMLNELNQFVALLLSDANMSSAFTVTQTQALTSLFLDIYQHGFVLAHIFFGLWLLPMGYLIIRSGFLPKVIGFLLLVAGVGYVADFALYYLVPGFPVKISVFTFVGEVALLLWLLIMGVNVGRWEQRALESARADLVVT